MRHKVHGRRLNRDTGHRNALRRNMIADLLIFEKITTTEAKARTIRPAAEKMITLAKRGLAEGGGEPTTALHARRLAAARLPGKRTKEGEDGTFEDVDVVRKLFEEIAPRYANRPGGYTRMVKIGRRPGDNADMAVLMLVED
ncbi:50S ribosomal subunit protein L17 [Candidatus Promineifilum breve]|jgi:large subunit ribosomal protein L17|uniref:Large ribosomal subunit protein bL17 n=1 Tax=Candidatus Promineifilum breve TaxID=1806508 RepID=A0A160T4U1_9CHLR|nr:50S ribosomal protein L17 [Candidatus Promineifilum breve]CUS05341.2 50S ribosomal subunit protein L17 [Candidatus Promineifilum breve]